MSDEPIRTDEPRPHAPAGIWKHLCEHPGCEKQGGWGHAVGKVTHWYCSEHKPRDVWFDMP